MQPEPPIEYELLRRLRSRPLPQDRDRRARGRGPLDHVIEDRPSVRGRITDGRASMAEANPRLRDAMEAAAIAHLRRELTPVLADLDARAGAAGDMPDAPTLVTPRLRG